MRVIGETHKCVGAGQCAVLSPEVFDQGDDGIVVVLQTDPAEELHDTARQAAELCPSRAIRIMD